MDLSTLNNILQPYSIHWETAWNWALSLAGGNETLVVFVASLLVSSMTYFIFGALHLPLDILGVPSFLWKFKIQPKQVFQRGDLGKLFRQLSFNWLVCATPTIYLVALVGTRFDRLDLSPTLPALSTVLRDLAVFIVVEEILFFYGHKFLHNPRWYKAIHKKHHEFTSPIALAAAYAHPLEFLWVNVVPLGVGPLLMRAHLSLTLAWFMATSIGTEVHHCGYRFPWSVGDQPNFHDYHHEKFNFNFGLLGILDRLHGTYRLPEPTNTKKE